MQLKGLVYICVLNKSFGQFWDFSHKSFIFLKTVNSEFLYIYDKYFKLLKLEDNTDFGLLLKLLVKTLVKTLVKILVET